MRRHHRVTRPPPALPAPASPHRLSEPFVTLDTETAGSHRHVGCRHYDACLGYVVAVDWPNFTCRPCVLFVREVELVVADRVG